MVYLKSMLLIALLYIGANGIKRLNQHVLVPEDTPVHAVIGNILSFGQPNVLKDNHKEYEWKFSILREGNPFANYFEISNSSGDIFLLKNLDREEICRETEHCVIKLAVALSSESKMIGIFPVDILVTDVNDNAPFFRESLVHVEFLEDAEVTTTFPIPSAIDLDMGDNSVITYQISPASGLFALDVTRNLDGTDGLHIRLARKLDAQTQQLYRLRLEAKDGGSPPRTGTTTIVVSVLAVNRSPVFTSVQTIVTVEENSAINSPVIKVKAKDEDSGVNGQLSYRLSADTAMSYPGTFRIDPLTGDVFSLKMFDHEAQNFYRLTVEAVDRGTPALTSTSVVNVKVLDVNDNFPEIKVNFLPDTDEAFVSESAEVQHFVAEISVSDKDSGVNADITCTIDDEHFLLTPITENEFQLVLTAKLDREISNQHRVFITCYDGGKQPNIASTEIVVNIVDENDNAPRFIHADPTVHVYKYAKVGNVICHVTAVDDDQNDNAKISYAIVPESKYFSVDQNSGSVFVSQSLDYLTQSEVTLTVVAMDNGNSPKQTSIDITVNISSRSNMNSNKQRFDDVIWHADNTFEFSDATIVASVIILISVLAAILITVICCVRGSNSEDTDESQKSGENFRSTIPVISSEKLTKNVGIVI